MLMYKTVFEFLKHLKIPVSKEYCEQLISGHTDYPSLLSIADTFERLGIPHSVRRISEKDLPDLNFPYMLHLIKEEGDLILIKELGDLKEIHKDLIHWSGVVVQAEPISALKDAENNIRYREEQLQKKLHFARPSSIFGCRAYLFYFSGGPAQLLIGLNTNREKPSYYIS